MSDPTIFDPFIHHAAPITKHVTKHVKQVAEVVPIIKQGYSMLTLILSNLASAALAGGLSWYVSRRGVNGVKTDLNNAKKEIEDIKSKLNPSPVAEQPNQVMGNLAGQ